MNILIRTDGSTENTIIAINNKPIGGISNFKLLISENQSNIDCEIILMKYSKLTKYAKKTLKPIQHIIRIKNEKETTNKEH